MKRIDWDGQYRKEAPKLKGLCRRYVADATIADDIVQETFITAFEKIDTYKGSGSFEGWIRKIAINKALNYIKEHQYKQLSLENIIMGTADDQHELAYSPNKFRRAIEQASFSVDELLLVLDDLPVHHKTVFNLYVLDGYKHHQIAEMLNISTGTSKSHLSRARKKAQELLYENAKQKTTEDHRKRRGFILLFFAPHSVDRIFRKGFKTYQLKPTSFSFPAKSVSLIKGGMTIGKAALYGLIASTAITGAIILRQNNSANRMPSANSTLIITIPDTAAIIPVDSIKSDSIFYNEEDKMKDPAIQNTKNNAPVLIRKKIIVHDTIRLPKPVSK